jgi:hypothetical protein
MNRFQAAVVAVVLAVGMFCLAEITTAKAAPTPTPQTNASPGSKQAEPKADPGVATNQAASGQGEKFSDEEYGWLYEEVTANRDEALSEYRTYRRLYIGFKIALLGLAIAATVCSIIATGPKKKFAIASAILTATIGLLSSFAFTEFDFGKSQQIYRKKADALTNLMEDLDYNNPSKAEFFKQYRAVKSWDLSTSSDTSPDLGGKEGKRAKPTQP